MALHHSLRDLVSVRGAGVVDDAEEFRGVLDDFLAEDEATLGELNLLVDGVRLGALRRVLDVIAHGAAPEAAIREAGAALARDRGTDDPTRSCWALASLCFALGKVDESKMQAFLGDTGTSGTQFVPDRPPSPSVPAPPGPGPGSSSAPSTASAFDGHVSPVVREERSSRTSVYLLVVLVGLLLGGLVAAGIILLPSDNGGSDPPLVSAKEMLVEYKNDGISKIYAVNAIDGGFRPELTPGPDDRLPTVSPDGRTMTYLVALKLYRLDLETGASEPFFEEAGPCDHSLRPGWSLDGNQVALMCTGNDGDPDGIWLSDADGNLESEPIVPGELLRGAPTWVSATTFIYGRQDNELESAPSTFWQVSTVDRVPSQIEVGLEGLQLTHPDYSEETGKVLFLVSPPDDPDTGIVHQVGREIGDVWTMDPDGSSKATVSEGNYSHPVWSPDGKAIGVTIYSRLPTEDDRGAEELGYIPLDDPDHPVVVEDPPPGDVGPPVWATR